jgi:glutamate---cysteine ligase / carboxylate-amine ligase
VMDRLRPHAEELGSVGGLEALEDILENGTGSTRQRKVYDTNHDLTEVVREVVDATAPQPAEAPEG